MYQFARSPVKYYSESKYSVELLSSKYLVNSLSDQCGDFSIEFRMEKLTIFHLHLTLNISIESADLYMHMESSYRDICMEVTPQSIWIHCSQCHGQVNG